MNLNEVSLVNFFLLYGFVIAPALTLVREGYKNNYFDFHPFWFVPCASLSIANWVIIAPHLTGYSQLGVAIFGGYCSAGFFESIGTLGKWIKAKHKQTEAAT